ncbi:four-carbon acid sugar kinase family protein [Salsuginibacillus kocurii]|uniref:four-carbon acid sugar kinase family protein n=1 Tax=Salsuginibacillus kocurii TaxID=427078 RepID=UPI000372FBEA|nr:four-carbon acid sugar kinase family protein [Salsuginibacillus kocurii]
MDICIIADDLTGANDSGVQCTQYGYRPSVALNTTNMEEFIDREALVIDTDSRGVPVEEAYTIVKEAVAPFVQNKPKLLYKKIDSTMRGNIGRELDALYDAFSPDFIIATPAYPANGRTVINGALYVNDVLLTETGIATQPDQAFESAQITDLLQTTSDKQTYHLKKEELTSATLPALLTQLKEEGIVYLSFDSESELELEQQVKLFSSLDFQLIWAGSAGAAQYLPPAYGLKGTFHGSTAETKSFTCNSALFVVGSRSEVTQQQKAFVAESIQTFTINPTLFLEDEWKTHPSIQEVLQKISANEAPFLLLSPETDEGAIERVKEKAAANNLTMAETTKQIASGMGDLVRAIFEIEPYESMLMTGGDIAKAVCASLESTEFELIREFETGIPIGKLHGTYNPVAITKAGAFGSEETFSQALHELKGEVQT